MQQAEDRRDTPAPPGRKKLRLLVILFITGACGWLVMEMEIIAGRMLTPPFGSDVYVTWGSVIGVFLLCLAVGYALGGWLSGKQSNNLILGISLAVAGLWLCLTPLLVDPVSDWLLEHTRAWLGSRPEESSPTALRLSALLASIALFAVPLVALGTVSPTAVRWLTDEARESGQRAGMVLAFSTAASFVGCLATAWYLVMFSTRKTVWWSGGALAALGAAIAAHALWQRNRSAQKR
jgi:MFS family permease